MSISLISTIKFQKPLFEIERQHYDSQEAFDAVKDNGTFPVDYIVNVAGTLYQYKGLVNGTSTWEKYNPVDNDTIVNAVTNSGKVAVLDDDKRISSSNLPDSIVYTDGDTTTTHSELSFTAYDGTPKSYKQTTMTPNGISISTSNDSFEHDTIVKNGGGVLEANVAGGFVQLDSNCKIPTNLYNAGGGSGGDTSNCLQIDGSNSMAANLNMGTFGITNIAGCSITDGYYNAAYGYKVTGKSSTDILTAAGTTITVDNIATTLSGKYLPITGGTVSGDITANNVTVSKVVKALSVQTTGTIRTTDMVETDTIGPITKDGVSMLTDKLVYYDTTKRNTYTCYNTNGGITDINSIVEDYVTFQEMTFNGDIAIAGKLMANESSDRSSSKVFATDGTIVSLPSGGGTGGSIQVAQLPETAGQEPNWITASKIVFEEAGGYGIQVATNTEKNRVEVAIGTDYLKLDGGGTVKGNITIDTTSTYSLTTPNLNVTNVQDYKDASGNNYSDVIVTNGEGGLFIYDSKKTGQKDSIYPLLNLSSTASKDGKYICASDEDNCDANKVFATDGSVKDLGYYNQALKQIAAMLNKAGGVPSPKLSNPVYTTRTWVTNPTTAKTAPSDSDFSNYINVAVPNLTDDMYRYLESIKVVLTVNGSSSVLYTSTVTASQDALDKINNEFYTIEAVGFKNHKFEIPSNVTVSEGNTINTEVTFKFTGNASLTTNTTAFARRETWTLASSSVLNTTGVTTAMKSTNDNNIDGSAEMRNYKEVVAKASAGEYAYFVIPTTWTSTSLSHPNDIVTYFKPGKEDESSKVSYGITEVGNVSFSIQTGETREDHEYTIYRSTNTATTDTQMVIEWS